MAELKTLHNLFEDELRDIYDAERQILKALPKIIKAVSDQSLREALNEHLEETRGQVDRLDQAFESLALKVKGKHCSGMEGILEEGRDLLEEEATAAVMDAAFIAGCQRLSTMKSRRMGRSWRGQRFWATPMPWTCSRPMNRKKRRPMRS